MSTNYRSGQNVSYGMYVSTRPLDVRFVGVDGEKLEGRDDAEYRHIPNAMAMLAAPVLGGLFVISFPITIFLAAARAMTQAAGQKVNELSEENAHLARHAWQPQAAFLKGESEAVEGEVDEKVAVLEAEVEGARKDEK